MLKTEQIEYIDVVDMQSGLTVRLSLLPGRSVPFIETTTEANEGFAFYPSLEDVLHYCRQPSTRYDVETAYHYMCALAKLRLRHLVGVCAQPDGRAK